MDADRFETLLWLVSTMPSRRTAIRVLAAAVGGTFASRLGAGNRDGEAAKGTHHQRRGKAQGKKKPCPPCKKRKKGKCKGLLPDGSACAAGTCQGGSCVVTLPPCTPTCAATRACGHDGCGGSCGSCTNGRTCEDGICTCPTACCGDSDCAAGKRCLHDQCVTWEGTCEAGDNACNGTGTAACNAGPNCICMRSLTNEARCGTVVGTACSCSDDANCQAAMSDPDAFCIGPGIACGSICAGQNICARPCAS